MMIPGLELLIVSVKNQKKTFRSKQLSQFLSVCFCYIPQIDKPSQKSPPNSHQKKMRLTPVVFTLLGLSTLQASALKIRIGDFVVRVVTPAKRDVEVEQSAAAEIIDNTSNANRNGDGNDHQLRERQSLSFAFSPMIKLFNDYWEEIDQVITPDRYDAGPTGKGTQPFCDRWGCPYQFNGKSYGVRVVEDGGDDGAIKVQEWGNGHDTWTWCYQISDRGEDNGSYWDQYYWQCEIDGM